MGNCSLKGVTQGEATDCSSSSSSCFRVLTDGGEIIDGKGPKLAREFVHDFPGYAVCRRGQASLPLQEDECLVNGGFYYLLPLDKLHNPKPKPEPDEPELELERAVVVDAKQVVNKKQVDHEAEPPKMSSADFVENLSSSGAAAMEVLPSQKNGVWKVKLVISSQQLEDILSEQVNTEALIEKMRMAATATATSATPRRSKTSWVVGWKPALSNVLFKPPGLHCH